MVFDRVGNPSVLPDVQTSSDPRFHRERSVREGLVAVPVCDQAGIGSNIDKHDSEQFLGFQEVGQVYTNQSSFLEKSVGKYIQIGFSDIYISFLLDF